MDLGGEEKNGRAKKREYEKVKMKNNGRGETIEN